MGPNRMKAGLMDRNGFEVAEVGFWQRAGPALRAALAMLPLLVLQELVSDLLPVVGSLVSLPVWMFLYYLQGLLVGYWSGKDSRTAGFSAGKMLGQGALSAFWSGVVFSTVISLVSLAVSSLLTLGAALIKIPFVLTGSLLDMLLNLVFCSLGAWVYAQRRGRRLTGVSCLVGMGGLVGYCLVVGALGAVLALGGFQFLGPQLKQYLPFLH